MTKSHLDRKSQQKNDLLSGTMDRLLNRVSVRRAIYLTYLLFLKIFHNHIDVLTKSIPIPSTFTYTLRAARSAWYGKFMKVYMLVYITKWNTIGSTTVYVLTIHHFNPLQINTSRTRRYQSNLFCKDIIYDRSTIGWATIGG